MPLAATTDTRNEINSLLQAATPEAAVRLAELSRSSDKETAKAARGALYKLKQVGVEPPPLVPAALAQSSSGEQTASRAWISGHTGLGAYLLVFLREDPYGGSPTVISVLVDQRKGVAGVKGRKLALKAIEDNIRDVAERDKTVLAEAPVDYAKHLLTSALERNEASRTPIPEGFSTWKKQIGAPLIDFPTHPIYESIDPDELKADKSISRDPFALFEHKPFTGWILDPNLVDPWEEKYFDSQQSILALDKSQIEQRGEAIIDEAADALLSSGALSEIRERLEHVAYVLQLSGDTERSRQALYHAVSISDSLPPHAQSFPRAFVKRSIYVVIALKAEQEPESEPETPGLVARA